MSAAPGAIAGKFGTRRAQRWLHAIDDRAGPRLRVAIAAAVRPRPERPSCSVWSQTHISLKAHEGTWRPGLLDLNETPFMIALHDAISDPDVREITFMKGSQLGGTRWVLDAIGWWIDCDPGQILYLSGTKEASDDLSSNRLRPLFERDCPPLVARRSHVKAHWKDDEFWFDACIVRLAGGRAVMGVSQHAQRYVILDELDKFNQTLNIEQRAADRVKTFSGSEKVLKVSTTTNSSGRINKSYLAGTQERFHVPCPRCGVEQLFRFEQIRWRSADGAWSQKPDGLNPTMAAASAYYECEHCHGRIEHRHKKKMLAAGRWIARFPERHAHRSFRLSSLYAPQLGWDYFVKKFLCCFPTDDNGFVLPKSRPRPADHETFVNEDLAEMADPPSESATEQQIRDHQNLGTPFQYKPGICPFDEPLEVILYADVMHAYSKYVVRAFSPKGGSAMLEFGTVQTLAALEDIAVTSYENQHGDPIVINRVALDSSDGTRVREVYDICRRHGWIACKNFDSSQRSKAAPPVSVSKNPPPGVRLFLLITTPTFKHWLTTKLLVPPQSPGSWYLHDQITDDYVREMTSEKLGLDEFGDPIWLDPIGPNHWWDVEVALEALAYHFRVHLRSGRARIENREPRTEDREPSAAAHRSPHHAGRVQPGRTGPGDWR